MKTQSEGVWMRFFSALKSRSFDDVDELLPPNDKNSYGKTYRKLVNKGRISAIHGLEDISYIERMQAYYYENKTEGDIIEEYIYNRKIDNIKAFHKWLMKTVL